ncbi:MAG: hypothetical protein ACI4F1_12255, partial [Bariatricus sp.]
MMKLWIDSESAKSAGRQVRASVSKIQSDVSGQVLSRGTRAVNALRNAELEVLRGQRSGKKYRVPYTKKATYKASAPGEPPARRTGNLRLHWNGNVEYGKMSGNNVEVVAVLESGEKYSEYLEKGTRKMA